MGRVEIEVNDSSFQEKVVEASKKTPIVVDFWAEWCGPCHMLSSIISKLAKEYKGKFILAKINVDQNPKTAAKYQIMSIPNVKMFKNGNLVSGFVGAIPEIKVREWLNNNL
jgi:putative thioredoxin